MNLRDQIIKQSIFVDDLRKAVRNTNSSEPDRLGDQLFCILLKIQWETRENPIISDELKNKADSLLQQYESTRGIRQ